jgi:hypothetical protein
MAAVDEAAWVLATLVNERVFPTYLSLHLQNSKYTPASTAAALLLLRTIEGVGAIRIAARDLLVIQLTGGTKMNKAEFHEALVKLYGFHPFSELFSQLFLAHHHIYEGKNTATKRVRQPRSAGEQKGLR